MNKVLQILLTSPIFAAMTVVGNDAMAVETVVNLENKEAFGSATLQLRDDTFPQEKRIAQVTSVSQLSDVQPTDWAFQALQSLVERYGCIAGYPNQTYRGNRALTRYEFAAGLNACLDRVNELIATATADLVTREDLAALQRLQEQFAPELATLRGRVDAVEARTAQIEANQFSTTTKLEGEVVAAFVDTLEGDTDGEDNTTFGARARVNFATSFTGKDLLYTRIQTNNIVSPDIGTAEGNLAFGVSSEDATTDAVLDALFYAFPLTEQTSVIAIANAGAADDVADTVNQFDGDGTEGAFSAFGTRNPIYYQMDGAGLGITQQFGDRLSLSLAYLGSAPEDPSRDSGIFNGPYGALAQLTFEPSDRFKIGFTYINAYNQQLGTGSRRANPISFLEGENVPSPDNPDQTNTVQIPFANNSYGIQTSLGLSDKIRLGGWVGYTNSRNLSTEGGTIDRGSLDIWNWAVTLGFYDLGKKGNLAGIIVGMEPKVTDSSIDEISKDRDTSYHIEAFYQFKVNDNIAITPGVIWLTAPDHNDNNNDVVIGALRTTFTF